MLNHQRIDRSLYGAQVKYATGTTTEYGEKGAEVDLFVANPGTVASYQEFRGTGGSLYYLRNQDITRGSEKLAIEKRLEELKSKLEDSSKKDFLEKLIEKAEEHIEQIKKRLEDCP